MKMLFSSSDRTAVGLLQSALEEAGIECELRNDAMQSNFPGAAFYPELWIIEDQDFPKAVEIRESLRSSGPIAQTPWTCPSCGEQLEAQFLSCWKCGTNRNVDA
jgi:hypothetical protein